MCVHDKSDDAVGDDGGPDAPSAGGDAGRGALLEAIHRIQLQFLDEEGPATVFDRLLAEVLRLTDSAYGFLGEVRHAEDGQPYLKAFSVMNLACDTNAGPGLEFRQLDTLFGATIATGEVVISNNPASDPRRGATPAGLPELHTFLGAPLHYRDRTIGMVGVANRPGGYERAFYDEMEPLWTTCSAMLHRYRTERRRTRAEDDLDRFFELSQDLMCIASFDARFRRVNEAFVRTLGWSREELLSREFTGFVHPDDVERTLVTLRGLSRGEGSVKDFENRYRCRDGRYRWISWRANLDPEHRVVHAVGCDVTEKKLEEARRQERRETEDQTRRLESLGQLAGGVAHDFNNLLMGIQWETARAQRVIGEGGCCASQLEQIQRAADQAEHLTRQLLEFGRRRLVEVVSMDLDEQVEATKDLLRSTIPEHVELRFEARPGLPRIWADPAQVEQVLINLCMNARDAMPQGGTLVISAAAVEPDAPEVEGAERKSWVRLSVTDTGEGMAEDVCARVFEPFFTTKPPGQGTGLGLATVHGIVTQHGGFVNVASTPGAGTEFRVYLPAVTGAEGETPPDDASAVEEVQPDTTDETILVVEDQVILRELIDNVLVDAGYTVLDAADGLEALELCETEGNRIDMALLDVVMPRMGGRRLYKELSTRWPDIAVLFMSGYAVADLDEAFLQREGLELLPKPYRAHDLLVAVRRTLERRGAKLPKREPPMA